MPVLTWRIKMKMLQYISLNWCRTCFGPFLASNRQERVRRILEESIELAQVVNIPRDVVHQFVDYTYARPVGDFEDEVKGVLFTLAILCESSEIDMETALGEVITTAVDRIEHIREKQRQKPDWLSTQVDPETGYPPVDLDDEIPF
jgi:NTP pyrophosphatase (non-canonical NTP hydrolase)